MSTAIPHIPPRPTRAQNQPADTGRTLGSEMPKVPPRPTHRLERSVSPSRESFTRSPLNETSFMANHGSHERSSIYRNGSANNSNADLPPRPPSVNLPSIGQEGNEYADVFVPIAVPGTSPTQTRIVANDLELHEPKPSLPTSSAKHRLSTVTRTDSGQAAAYGIGKTGTSSSIDDKEPQNRKLKERASFSSQTSNNVSHGLERPPSSLESEHGIPEIGQRVPMYPNAGDVQAPSPSPFATPYAPGIGFHNDGSKPRHHARKTSARGEIPQDAYGRYGHGVPHQSDRFEKAYYEKHPELFKKELGQYGEGRPEWAMSSDDLNKIVRDTASRCGTTNITGTPTELVGFQASEEYASRISSPRPQSSHHAGQNASATHVDSPLKTESFPIEGTAKADFESALSRSLHGPSDSALESEAEEDTIHINEPGRRASNFYGSTGRLESTEDLVPHSAHEFNGTGDHDDHGYSAPILASDEVAKEPFGWELQPAVSPLAHRRGSYYDELGHHRSGSDSGISNSRPSSRPGSTHGNVPGLRISESTHLEDLEEYEPLFPEDEKNISTKSQPLTAADRLKRPDLHNRKFPSRDIWEDTPNSLQYTATVSTPQLPEDREEQKDFTETPEQAFARKQEEMAENEYKDSESFLHREQLKKKAWLRNLDLEQETRPALNQRFPSRDIWEDTPDSLQLETTVAAPQTEDETMSTPTERPTTGAVAYHQEKAAAGLPMGSDEGRATTGIAAVMKPQIPNRPAKSSSLSNSSEKAQHMVPQRPAHRSQVSTADGGLGSSPPIPVKTKPVIPARPSKATARESFSEHAPLTKVSSGSSAKSIGSDQGVSNAAKAKPPVPSRPVSGKIAALQGGFLSDLNKRLQLGPNASKKDEPAPEEQQEEKEKVPLADARKGRARGPARRAPAKSPAPATEPAATGKPLTLGFSVTSTLWEIDPHGDDLHVNGPEETIPSSAAPKAVIDSTPTLATNTSGQPLHEPSEIAPGAEGTAADLSTVEPVHAEVHDGAENLLATSGINKDGLEPVKSSDDPPVISDDTEPVDVEELAGSTGTVKPSSEQVL